MPEVRKGLCRSALDLTDGRNYFAFAVLLDGELTRLTGFTLAAVVGGRRHIVLLAIAILVDGFAAAGGVALLGGLQLGNVLALHPGM